MFDSTGWGQGFQIFDLTDPTNALLESTTNHFRALQLSLDHENSILYIKNHWSLDANISAYDVSNPTSPNMIDYHFFPELQIYVKVNGVYEWESGDMWYSEGYVYTVSGHDLVVLELNVPPVLESFMGPSSPVSINTQATFEGSCTDPNIPDTHTYRFDPGDGSGDEAAEDVACDGSKFPFTYTYKTVGVFTAK